MTGDSPTPVVAPATPRTGDQVNSKTTTANAVDEKTLPSLSSYFGEKKMQPAAFTRAVNVARLRMFDEADRTLALDLMYRNDPDGKRLWALISQRHLPDPINTWIWTAAKDRLTRVLGPEVDIANQAPAQLSDLIQKGFPTLSSTKDKTAKTAFVLSVRIVAAWLLLRRRIQLWEVIDFCSALLFSDERSAGQLTSAAIRSGSDKDLNLLASVGFLGRRRLADIQDEINRAKSDAAGMRQRLDLKVVENSELQSTVSELRQQNAELQEKLIDLRTQIETQRQHTGYDLTELKAGNSMLLRDRLSPLIQDAIDALEIETPAPEIAVRRLKRAVSTIEESLK